MHESLHVLLLLLLLHTLSDVHWLDINIVGLMPVNLSILGISSMIVRVFVMCVVRLIVALGKVSLSMVLALKSIEMIKLLTIVMAFPIMLPVMAVVCLRYLLLGMVWWCSIAC